MTAPVPQTTTGATRADEQPVSENASTGQLISQLTEQISRLVRDEARLAQAEVTQKAKKLGVGAGLFGGAGLVAFFGLAALITAVILALALVLPGWLAALIVAVVLFAVAGVLALIGKKDVEKGSPPVPTEAISSVKTDIATVKESARR
ncbi:phage holin family protein [Blastococcus brunescens]|uniref:Phage holin family protein n=1 Tax=Blastococcus brunescens TaxID=1564165 RepID=A0ABZ1B6H7_9ACTN|nr:phage holin family protein [Blastococcus sp. BMG 8361]WRL65972.1 phage holin family protein [Blastococcus sp. BMG 8361]